MTPDEIKKLLGGYATGTLTAEEQQALFDAALEDQELFDTLAREQSLRDLLRDPSARAELLSALDTPAQREGGFWQWLRRPALVGVATAGVAAIAVVAVWQGTRGPAVKRAEPVIVAELKRPEAAPAAPAAPVSQPQPTQQTRAADTPAPGSTPAPRAVRRLEPALQAELLKEKQVAATVAKDSGAEQAVIVADKKAVEAMAQAAPAVAPFPPPPQLPLFAVRKAESDAATAPQARQFSGAIGGAPPPDARALFYGGESVQTANSFAAGSGRPGALSPSLAPAAPRQDGAAPHAKGVVAGLVAPKAQPLQHLGLRVSILRGDTEADLTTILNPGETVRLRLTPNADGFLYVEDGARTVASGPAQRMKPFETPELRFEGSGPKLMNVIFSRSPRTAEAISLGSLAIDNNLVQSPSAQDRATYIVSDPNRPATPQIVVPITLKFR